MTQFKTASEMFHSMRKNIEEMKGKPGVVERRSRLYLLTKAHDKHMSNLCCNLHLNPREAWAIKRTAIEIAAELERIKTAVWTRGVYGELVPPKELHIKLMRSNHPDVQRFRTTFLAPQEICRLAQRNKLLPTTRNDFEFDRRGRCEGKSCNLSLYGCVQGLILVQVRHVTRTRYGGTMTSHWFVTNGSKIQEVTSLVRDMRSFGNSSAAPLCFLRPHLPAEWQSLIPADEEHGVTLTMDAKLRPFWRHLRKREIQVHKGSLDRISFSRATYDCRRAGKESYVLYEPYFQGMGRGQADAVKIYFGTVHDDDAPDIEMGEYLVQQFQNMGLIATWDGDHEHPVRVTFAQ